MIQEKRNFIMKFFKRSFIFYCCSCPFSKQRMTIYAQYDKIVVLDLVVVFYIAYLDDRTTTKNNVTIHVYTFILHILIIACLRKLEITPVYYVFYKWSIIWNWFFVNHFRIIIRMIFIFYFQYNLLVIFRCEDAQLLWILLREILFILNQ